MINAPAWGAAASAPRSRIASRASRRTCTSGSFRSAANASACDFDYLAQLPLKELVLLCGPGSRWASPGERSGEAKSEEILDYLIHVLQEKGLQKGPWINLPKTREQKDEDKRMSPNTKLLTGLKDLMKSEFGGMATLR